MSSSLNKYESIEVISYGRIKGMLSAGECISIHQWAQQGIIPNVFLRDKVKRIISTIKTIGWERPEFMYNTQLRLMYRTSSASNFKEFI